MANEVQKLRSLCRKWGGDLLRVSKEEFKELGEGWSSTSRHFHEAPFTDSSLGVHWPSRTIVYAGVPLWWEIVHEMGHAFASKEDPSNADELAYLGWEYQLAKSLGVRGFG